MAQRVKHLLEAFQQTGALQRGAPGQPGPASPAPAPAGKSKAAVLSHTRLANLLCLATGVLLGVLLMRVIDGSPSSSAADRVREPRVPGAGDSGQPSGHLPGPVAGPGPSATGSTGAGSSAAQGSAGIEQALRDPQNRFALLAITYGNSPANQTSALATAEWLRQRGFPAANPVLRNKSLCVLVGAAPSKGHLLDLQNQLRAATGPSGKTSDFDTAYAVEIDGYIQRAAH